MFHAEEAVFVEQSAIFTKFWEIFNHVFSCYPTKSGFSTYKNILE